jgi:hypothetical protein
MLCFDGLDAARDPWHLSGVFAADIAALLLGGT